jgi:hypothetical protein
MSAMENLREDAHNAPAQLEREADSARDAVEGTLDAGSWDADSSTTAADDALDATTRAGYDPADEAGGFVQRAADATRDAAGKVTDASRMSAQGLAEGYAYLSREQPLVLGAIAVAVGAAVGMLVPSTDSETS